jgi:hypothetical protein
MVGKVGHPPRPRGEAAAFGRLVEAEVAAGARTLGEAMTLVRRRDQPRWGSQRKMDGLWAEYKKIKPDVEALLVSLEALHEAADTAEHMMHDIHRRFPRLSVRSTNWLETTVTAPLERARSMIGNVEAEFGTLAKWRDAIKTKRRPE